MKIISYITLILLCFGLLWAATPVAVAIRTVGTVNIKNATSGKSETAKRGSRLANNDKIITEKNGRAAIKFLDDASLLRIRPNSTCTITSDKEKNSITKNILVEVGTIFSKISKQKASFKVTTPTSVASVKGTIFWTVQEFKGGTTYFGLEGIVDISNDAGSALMHEGETCYVSSKNSKPIVRKTRPGEVPTFDSGEGEPDDFEFEFQNDQGQKKDLKFKAKKSEQ